EITERFCNVARDPLEDRVSIGGRLREDPRRGGERLETGRPESLVVDVSPDDPYAIIGEIDVVVVPAVRAGRKNLEMLCLPRLGDAIEGLVERIPEGVRVKRPQVRTHQLAGRSPNEAARHRVDVHDRSVAFVAGDRL